MSASSGPRGQKWVHDAHRAVEPVMLKIFADDFRQTVVFRVSPQMRIEPVQLVRRASANRVAEDCFIRAENRELAQEFFRFAECAGLAENDVAANRARHGCDELEY